MDEQFTLEKMEVNKRLSLLETSHAVVVNKLDTVHDCVDRIEKMMVGNGDRGLLMKVDRLEQLEKSRTRHFFAIWAGFIAIACKAIIDFIQWRK